LGKPNTLNLRNIVLQSLLLLQYYPDIEQQMVAPPPVRGNGFGIFPTFGEAE